MQLPFQLKAGDLLLVSPDAYWWKSPSRVAMCQTVNFAVRAIEFAPNSSTDVLVLLVVRAVSRGVFDVLPVSFEARKLPSATIIPDYMTVDNSIHRFFVSSCDISFLEQYFTHLRLKS